jgi:hypothetical protein
MEHFRPDPKVKKAKRVNRDAMTILRERVLKLDRVCVVCQQRPSESIHHVVPRGNSGEDVAANLIGVCGSGVTRCHGALEARDRWARSRVRAVLEHDKPMVKAYAIDRAGVAWFETNYPLGGAVSAAGSAERASGPSANEGLSLNSPPPPARSKNMWGRPLGGWLDRAEVDAAYEDCLEILRAMARAGVAPMPEQGKRKGEAGAALLLIFDDFRDRHQEWLRKGAA